MFIGTSMKVIEKSSRLQVAFAQSSELSFGDGKLFLAESASALRIVFLDIAGLIKPTLVQGYLISAIETVEVRKCFYKTRSLCIIQKEKCMFRISITIRLRGWIRKSMK